MEVTFFQAHWNSLCVKFLENPDDFLYVFCITLQVKDSISKLFVKLLGLGFDFTFTCQGENHCNPWIKPLQPLDKTTATLG